ncbi:MAG: exo-alpha-sialidase [Coprobacter sp.]|nr:exo-alpha-sialidase [Coprobacter sp.]
MKTTTPFLKNVAAVLLALVGPAGWLAAGASGQETSGKIMTTLVQQGTVMTGIGNTDVPLLRITFTVDRAGENDGETLREIRGSLCNTTDFSDVTAVKAWLAPDFLELNTRNATPLAQTVPDANGYFNLQLDSLCPLGNGNRYIWLTADISGSAQEGNTVDMQINSYLRGNGEAIWENCGNPDHAATIFLTESVLFHPGDHHSRYYRIPAITTAADGSLVAVCDQRFDSEIDLPNKIDIVARRSTDNGKTWSPPVTIAGTPATGGEYGHGDPAIVTCHNGDILVLASALRGFWEGTPDHPALVKMIASHDNGLTWDAPVDITPQIYGSRSANPATRQWKSLFVGSGAFLQTRDGRLLATLLVRDEGTGKNNYLLCSGDNGHSWKALTAPAVYNGDEAKIIERNNGDILISSRKSGHRLMNLADPAATRWGTQWENETIWGANCNGDMIRYTSTLDGYDKNRLLHTIPCHTQRQNVSVLLSYDEGDTWTHCKPLCPRYSAYSALTVLPDGTIGCFIEDLSVSGGYSMRFVRFSLDWLTGGADTYIPSTRK